MTRPFSDTAVQLLAAGYSPLPILPGTKRPALSRWQRHGYEPMTRDAVERFACSPIVYGVGVALGFNQLVAIDIDTDDTEIVAAILEVLP